MYVFFSIVLALTFLTCLLMVAGGIYCGIQKYKAMPPEQRKRPAKPEDFLKAGCGLVSIGLILFALITLFVSSFVFLHVIHKVFGG